MAHYKKERREDFVNCRLSEEEQRMLDEIAVFERSSSSEIIRTLIREAAEQAGIAAAKKARSSHPYYAERCKKMQDMHNKGATLQEIADYYGLTRARVREIVDDARFRRLGSSRLRKVEG